MKVNKTTYLLLILVLAIWGYFVFSLVGDLSSDDGLNSRSLSPQPTSLFETVEKQKFELLENPRDPFLGKLSSTKQGQPNKQVQATRTATTWPNVIYKGMISGSNNSSRFIFAVNGKEHLVTKGQSFADLTLVSGQADEVKIRFSGETKTYTKQ